MNQRDGLSNENRRAFWRQAICGACSIKGRIPTVHLPAEKLFWLRWMNIFTTKAQSHEVGASLPPFPPGFEIDLCSLIIVH